MMFWENWMITVNQMLLPSKIFLQENKCPNDVFVILLQLKCETSIQVCNKTINCSCLPKSKYSRSKWPLKVDQLTKLIEEDVASCVNKWFDLLCHGLVPLPNFSRADDTPVSKTDNLRSRKAFKGKYDCFYK